MQTLKIKQKMSNTGTIYDIASDHGDININMGSRYNYVVIGPSYYNLGFTRHVAADSAIRAYKQLSNKGYRGVRVLDKDGQFMDIVPGFPFDRLEYVD